MVKAADERAPWRPGTQQRRRRGDGQVENRKSNPRRLWLGQSSKMKSRIARATVPILLVWVAIGSWAGQGAATESAPVYYPAVGGSASVGFQPTSSAWRGEPTDRGYADDLLALENDRWPELQ